MCSFHGSVSPRSAVLVFANSEIASRNMAGLPAAARAVHAAAQSGLAECWLVVGHDEQLDDLAQAEVRRVSGDLDVHLASPANDFRSRQTIWLEGEQLLGVLPDDCLPAESGISNQGIHEPARAGSAGCNSDHAATDEVFEQVERRIVAATGKPGDGIVSRLINRPISQAISRRLLRWPHIRPIHATAVTALLAIAMVICLLSINGRPGLIAGVLLFQAASIFDGVDGEIARATFRTSLRGAMLDSLVDAAANIGFIGGVAINLWIAGHREVAMAGLTGLAMMALGLFLIGRQAAKSGGAFTFNGAKERVCAGGSRLGQWLTWLTMRDFYALASVIFVLSGFTEAGLIAFAVVAAGWLAVVLFVMGVPARQTA